MAQAWESDAIKAAGDRWAAANTAYKSATDQAARDKAKADMDAAAAEAKKLREQSGYDLDGGKKDADVTVKNQSTWRSSGSESRYQAGVHGIGTPQKQPAEPQVVAPAPQVQQAVQSGLPLTYEELNALLEKNAQKTQDETKKYYEQLLQQQQQQIEHNTQQAIREQEALAEKQEKEAYEQQKAAFAQSMKDRANLAYQSAARGDAGGIGLKQYSDAANSYDRQLYEINLQLENLKAEVDQNVASLKAQGNFDAANVALEIGMAQIKDLQNQRDALQSKQVNLSQNYMSYRQQQDEIAFDRALQRLQLGAFTAEDAKALGISDADAERIATQLNITAQLSLKEAEKQLAGLKAQNTTGDVPGKQNLVVVGDYTMDTTGMDPKQVEALATMDAFIGDAARARNTILSWNKNGELSQDDVVNYIEKAVRTGQLTSSEASTMLLALLGVEVKEQ